MKKRFKMYKAGKAWVVAPLVFFGLAAGLSANVKAVAADTVSQAQKTTVTAAASSQSQTSTASSETTATSQATSTASVSDSVAATTATSEAKQQAPAAK